MNVAVTPEAGVLVRRRLDFGGTPFAVLGALRDLPHPFALTGRWAGGGAVVGAAPRRVLAAGEDPFAALDELPRIVHDPGSGAVGGGWFGYLGYGLGSLVEDLPPRPPRRVALPDFHLAHYDHVVRLDARGRWWLEALQSGADEPEDLERRLADTEARVRGAVEPADSAVDPPVEFAVAAPGHAGHRWAVSEAVDRIRAGDLFQVNLGLRLEADARLDPIELFIRAARVARPAYGAVFAAEWGGVVSLSPELFLSRRGREVTTGPIKGTVPRPGGAAAGVERERLLASTKDAAEHVMIVDLMRNDLGRVCEYGSVTREERRRVEPHPGVWHLVSDVSGTLREGCGDADLLRATFPPGSVTGAPKVQSMRLISELEGSGRELYTGALGYASPVAGLELSVAIRSFELSADRVWLGAGGGIVADSRPGAELDEALAKAAPLVAAAGGSIAAQASGRRARVPARVLVGADRPDPALGLLETAMIAGGEVPHLDAHLQRLASSVRSLYGAELPADLAVRAGRLAVQAEHARLRILVAPSGAGVDVDCEIAAPPPSAAGVELWPVALPGGLGAHKWRDRRLVDELTTRAGGAVPLLVDSDGDVLEAAWGNVWVVRDGVHRTPAADGRILAGVTRERRLAGLHRAGVPVSVGRVTLTDLHEGDAYLTSAMRERCPALMLAREPVRL